MTVMKTPGIYIAEKNAFPNSVIEVATAVPAFIGYTEKADNAGKTLHSRPWRISSLAEFHQHFGEGPRARFVIDERADPAVAKAQKARAGTAAVAEGPTAFTLDNNEYLLTQPAGKAGGRFLLYAGMRQFFQNGGGPCYVVSVGAYDSDSVEADALTGGIETLVKEQEPTMLVIPDCVLLDQPDCISVQQQMLAHCGDKTRSRFAILDIWGGWKDIKDEPNCIAEFRSCLGTNHLDFAAAYYPWLNTTVFQDHELDYTNITNLEKLRDLLRTELKLPKDRPPDNATPKERAKWDAVDGIAKPMDTWVDEARARAIADGKTRTEAELREDAQLQIQLLNKSLVALSPMFRAMMGELRRRLNLLPPSAAMAGVYAMVDNSRGVWKAPANVGIQGVTSPAVNLSQADQEDLNVTPQGKSINAIRAFTGEGVLVWGARTLDGNSLDWRYIPVRRTMIMLEASCKLAVKALVFEPNVANTWVTIKSMISNFLTGIWKRGGLAGAVPEDAFSVHVGLGETMTPEDILEGILRVTVLVAISRPAEFIEITFRQQMQKS